MRVLLSDGSGLTARQCATVLSEAGHAVAALTPDPLCLCRFTRHVRRLHRVPGYGTDPYRWLDAALSVYQANRYDVLFPTQEQVAVLSAAAEQLQRSGIVTAVPPFAALRQVQDKLSAHATLARVGLPQPAAEVVKERETLAAWTDFPVFVKAPIGTAAGGVRRVASAAELRAWLDGPGWWSAAFDTGGVLVQAPVDGQLAMAQSVFAGGDLVAFHANVRLQEGARGGACRKRGLDLPAVREYLTALGKELGWHGALSADVMLGPSGPAFIDINPRLVEPVNALRSGVDLVTAMLHVAGAAPAGAQPAAPSGALTHQLLLAVLGAAQHSGKRRRVIAELLSAALHFGAYRGSTEELTPIRRDPIAAVPVLLALATAVRPRSWTWFASGSVDGYALTPAGWRQIVEQSTAGPAAN